MNQVRRVPEQPAALMKRLIDQPQLTMFEVAQPAVHQLRGYAARSTGKVPFIDESDAKAAQRGVERHTRAGDAAAENQ
jgi:hypothetical protein